MDTIKRRSLRKYIVASENILHVSQISSFLGSQSSIPHVHIIFGLKACKAKRCAAASTPARVPAMLGLPYSRYNNSHRLLPGSSASAHRYGEFIWLLLHGEEMGDPMWSMCLFLSDMFVWPSTPPLAKVVPLVNSIMELYNVKCSLSLEYIFLSISRHSSHCP